MSGGESSFGGRRRSERVLLRIPLKLYATSRDNTKVHESSETVVVSRHGALIRTSVPLKMGSPCELRNAYSDESEQFRVVWAGEKPVEGKFEAGVEMVTPREDFWGVRFPPKERKSV